MKKSTIKKRKKLASVEKIVHSVKKIWKGSTKTDGPEYFHPHISSLDSGLMIRSAEKFGTPQYLLDENALEQRGDFFISTFRRAIPNAEFFYAMKCNDLPHISKTLKRTGFNADVAGLFELKMALKLGFDKIIFTSPGKNSDELRLAIKNSKKVFLNIDNLDELDLLLSCMREDKIRKKIRISFRINPDFSSKTWSKYGIEMSQLEKAIRLVRKEKYLKLSGLHFHSSWNQTPEKYLKKIKALGEYLKEHAINEAKKLEFLDLGGGFFPEDIAILSRYSLKGDLVRIVHEFHEDSGVEPKIRFNDLKFRVRKVDPLDFFAKSIAASLEKYIYPINKKLRIFFEPGRFLVTHSTSILLKVVAVKKSGVIVDGGVNLLGDYRFEEYSFAPVVNLSQPSLKIKKRNIYGPLCDPSDIWGYSYYGNGIKKGDILAALHQGAYTFSCAWRFIKPTAAYAAMHNKRLYLAKKEESFKDRFSGCII